MKGFEPIKIDHEGIHDPKYPVPIVPDSEFWFEWLESHKSFRFDSPDGHFNANRDNRFYWTASRKVSGQLRRKRLGKASDISYNKLADVAYILAQDMPRGVYTSSDSRQKIAELQLELEKAYAHIKELESQLREVSLFLKKRDYIDS